MIVTKQQAEAKAPITDNFTADELYSDSFDAPDTHYLDDDVVFALQSIRDYYGVRMGARNTFRTTAHNVAVGGESKSMHLKGKAIDLYFLDNNAEMISMFEADIDNRGELYNILRSYGVDGIGVYNTFIHIDTRKITDDTEFNQPSDEVFGRSWSYWKKKSIINNYTDGIPFGYVLVFIMTVLGLKKTLAIR